MGTIAGTVAEFYRAHAKDGRAFLSPRCWLVRQPDPRRYWSCTRDATREVAGTDLAEDALQRGQLVDTELQNRIDAPTAIAIYQRYHTPGGDGLHALSRDFGFAPSTIHAIVRGRHYLIRPYLEGRA